jgi:hypothetical protein
MKIILSKSELLKEIRSIILEVSDEVRTDFQEYDMYRRSKNTKMVKEISSFASKSSISKMEIAIMSNAPKLQPPGSAAITVFYCHFGGEFFIGPNLGVKIENGLLSPVDADDSQPASEGLSGAFKSEGQEEKLLLVKKQTSGTISYNKRGFYESKVTYISDPKVRDAIEKTPRLKTMLMAVIVQTAMANIDKCTIDSGVKDKVNQNSSKESSNLLAVYKENLKGNLNILSEWISKKIDNMGIQATDTDLSYSLRDEPFIIKKGKLALAFKRGDAPRDFKFSSFEYDSNTSTYQDFEKYLENTERNFEELNDRSSSDILSMIKDKKRTLESKWPGKK